MDKKIPEQAIHDELQNLRIGTRLLKFAGRKPNADGFV